jgi:hypothetical protein
MFKNVYKGPEKAPVFAKLTEIPKFLKNFKEIAKSDK